MRISLVVAACSIGIAGIIGIAGPALACRGTTEFPQVTKQLETATIAPEAKKLLTEKLKRGREMHNSGHVQFDGAKLSKSLRLLDEVKEAINK